LTQRPAGEHARDETFWVDGDMLFQVEEIGVLPGRLVKVRRPFALIGRSAPSDILLDDPAVNGQHVYLHQDERGVFAVDLATRSGSRINGEDRMVGWLRPGDAIEVAGFRVELVRARVANVPLRHRTEASPSDDEMLRDSPRHDLPRMTLDPRVAGERPWVLGSELVFLGSSAACGVRVRDPAVARAHCAIVRAASGVFLVDLADGPTWVEDQSPRPSGALPLHDGDFITLGNTRFSVRIEPPSNATAVPTSDTLPARYNGVVELASIDPEALPPETQNALLAWMMGTIQGGQGEALRRQGEFQLAMTEALRSIQQDNATLLNAHLSRLEKIDRELVALRAELERREGGPPARMVPVPPDVAPLNIPRNVRAREADPPGVQASTSWLLQRVGQLEAESRSTWKDFLGRAPSPKKSDATG
jgi:pSer/pThr/pTyr-binding forkhead associated (FHA) protein